MAFKYMHRLTRRRVLAASAAFGSGAMLGPALRIPAASAGYPDRPIKIVVANTPGGPSDIIARMMAAAMQGAMNATVFVENKGGAGGNIGMGSVARAEPDGYTILLSTSAFAVNPGLYQMLPYDPVKDFTAICELAVSPHVFAVKPDLGVATMKEFVAVAKASPEKFNVSTPPHAATSGRSSQAARRAARDGDDRVSGWWGCAQGLDRRDGSVELRRACTRASSDQGRHDQSSGGDGQDAVA